VVVIFVVIKGSKKFKIDKEKMKIGDVFRELGLNVEEYIPVSNGNIVTEHDEVKDGDLLTLYPVVSGG